MFLIRADRSIDVDIVVRFVYIYVCFVLYFFDFILYCFRSSFAMQQNHIVFPWQTHNSPRSRPISCKLQVIDVWLDDHIK